MIHIPNLIEAVLVEKSKKIKRYPCHVNRASSLGYAVEMLGGCLRRGVYERTNWGDKKMWEVTSILIFEEGDRQENAVFRDLLDAGHPIIEQQTPYEWKTPDGELLATGHIDGKLICQDDNGQSVAVPVEIKSMHPNIFGGIYSLEDFKKKPWTRAYLAQITLYMLMNNIDIGLFILKNKSSGQLKQLIVNLDYELGEKCIQAAEQINQHVKARTLPDRCKDRDVCKECPFNHICLPDLNFGQEIEIGDDPSFESKVKEYLEIKEAGSKAKNLWEKVIRPKMAATAKDGNLNLLIGNYHLTGKLNVNGAFLGKIKLIDEDED